MSLLLQALKKAEEDKRRRAETALDSEAHAAEVEFPALNLVEGDALTPDPVTQAEVAAAQSDVSEVSEWDFVPLEIPTDKDEPTSEVQTEPEMAMVVEIQNSSVPSHLIEPTAQTPEADQVTAEIVAPAQPVEVPVIDSVKKESAEPITSVAPPTSSLSPPTQPQVLAKGLFAKSKKPPTRGLLPWLLLGAGLLLAGMVAWFAWQYHQLTQPIPKVEVREPITAEASPVANESVYVDEGIANNGLDVDTYVDLAAISELKPTPPVLSQTPAKVEATRSPAPATITDSKELNPPLKFVRQSPALAGPDPVLLAWQFYQHGDLNQAELFYQKALQADPRQRDALLGLAAIAQQRGNAEVASALYQRILRDNPQDESAKTALMLLNSAQMPEHEAVQLEQSGQSAPMVLGQYFATQQRWSQAQEQFFLAYSANPNSADAALNLAVSLDHLKQTSLARTYYRKALQTKETIYFDRNKVEQRLAELDAASGVSP